ncbi:hypothetical protein AQJ23_04120 [Streptomyces antibioticus]|nr:hypothetical protein AQJ23_04120 [Streptomyces antibioticus]
MSCSDRYAANASPVVNASVQPWRRSSAVHRRDRCITLRDTDGTLSAAGCAAATGISRVSARRYLEHFH